MHPAGAPVRQLENPGNAAGTCPPLLSRHVLMHAEISGALPEVKHGRTQASYA
jgi:hypothetical protein